MKKILLLFVFFLAVMVSYSQVTTDPKKQPENISTNDNTNIKPASLTPLCYGKIAADRTIIGGTRNFTISKNDNGYLIVCKGLTDKSIVFITNVDVPYYASYDIKTSPTPGVQIRMRRFQESVFAPFYADFQFIIYNP